jgi:hypothetical protein
MAEEQLVFAYCDGTIFSFERADIHSESVFGGPMMAKLSGIEHGPKALHLIAALSSDDLPALGRHYVFDLPLIYGMCYDGCNLDYRVDVGRKVELLKLSPTQSSDDWPYPNYPTLLPCVPLQIAEKRSANYAEFAEAFCNMPEQQTTELVVAVPNVATLGVSLWGNFASEVTIVFECDLAERMVYAFNVCD